MGYFAKFVTIILLATLSLAPALAAAPCQEDTGCMACCSGTTCPTAANMMGSQIAGHKGMSDISAPSCVGASHLTVAFTDRQTNEAPSTVAIGTGISYVVPFLRAQNFRRSSAELSRRYGPGAQAVLSTFLI